MARHLAAGREVPELRARFESALRELVPVRAVRLRDQVVPTGREGAGSTGFERACFDVPTRPGTPCVSLEASLSVGSALDAWDRQVLTMASNLAALVVELEHRPQTPVRESASARAADGRGPLLVGTSPAMANLRARIGQVAATDFIVLIQGESGTGKELVARQIHQLSQRRHGPFIAINCAAIVDSLLEAELFGIEDRTATGVRGRRGKFEHAEGGTLFLDEVSDLTQAAQAKLLRAIQELTVERVGGHHSRRVDVRIVVATNKSLRELAARRLFREDLYYRLSGVELQVPPLRSRREDIPELVRHFLARYRTPRPLCLSIEAAEAMRAYDWPGNVRELERLIEGAVTTSRSERIGLDDLPSALRDDYADILLPSLARDDSMRAWGARYARLMLEKCRQNKRRACRVLDISYHTLQAYLRWPGGEAPGSPPLSDGERLQPGRDGEGTGGAQEVVAAPDPTASAEPEAGPCGPEPVTPGVGTGRDR
jgi:DNA-binding NtrC family response regulator